MAKEVTPPLFYERRSKQYLQNGIKQHQVVTLAGQCAAFLAMFCEEPHSVHRYYGEVLRSNRGRLFRGDQQPFPYYIAAVTLNRIEILFNHGDIDRKYRQYKYHLLLLVRILVLGEALPPLTSKKIIPICQEIMKIIVDKNALLAVIAQACKLLETQLTSYPTKDESGNPPSRRREFTMRLVPTAAKKRPHGRVVHFNTDRGFGFIKSEAYPSSDIFIHVSSICESKTRLLQEGDFVEFDIIETPKGPQAENVVLVPFELATINSVAEQLT